MNEELELEWFIYFFANTDLVRVALSGHDGAERALMLRDLSYMGESDYYLSFLSYFSFSIDFLVDNKIAPKAKPVFAAALPGRPEPPAAKERTDDRVDLMDSSLV